MIEPRITIGITAYNEGDWLLEAWESSIAQSDARWEAVMILDGGADDHTTRVFDSIKHPQLRKLVLRENAGPYATRTVAIRSSRTPWYAHLDADDRLPTQAIERIVSAIDAHPDAQFVYGDCLHFNQDMSYVRVFDKFDEESLMEGTAITATSPIKVALFEQIGFAPELSRGGADWDFWISVSECNVKGVRVKGIIYERRNRPSSVGSRWRLERDQVARKIIRRHPRFFASIERRNRCLGRAYEIMAREYRSLGEREKAAVYAKLAAQYGLTTPTMLAIMGEEKMPLWRYMLRRLGRYSHKARVLGKIIRRV